MTYVPNFPHKLAINGYFPRCQHKKLASAISYEPPVELHSHFIIYIYVFIHLHIEVHVLYMVYSKDNTNTILYSIITDKSIINFVANFNHKC